MDRDEKILLFFVIFGAIFLLISFRFIVSDDSNNLVEKDGYCKLIYGKDFHLNEKTGECYNQLNKSITKSFSEEDFNKVCEDIKFFSVKSFSNCFKAGDSRV